MKLKKYVNYVYSSMTNLNWRTKKRKIIGWSLKEIKVEST